MKNFLKNVLTKQRNCVIINSTNKTTAQNNKKKGKVIPLDITESISQAISHDNGPADSTRIALIR